VTGRFVLDSSVAIAWFFPESESERLYAAAVNRLIRDGEATALVPELFHAEVAEFFMRRRRTPAARFGETRLANAVDDLDALGIHTVVRAHTYRDVIAWAKQFHVQAKDAAFVQLAHQTGLRLATLDNGQRTAARSFGIGLVEFH
jgi:predicted nucleic acid-binding protein